MLWKPDILAEVYLFPTESGGRSEPLHSSLQYFGCPIEFEGEMFDVRFDLSEKASGLMPGTTAELNAKFLSPELIKPRLKVGDEFRLWDGKFFGKGKVLSVQSTLNSLFDTDAQGRLST
jgi:hypothetical protein